MHKYLVLLALFAPCLLFAQIAPKEGSMLNYRLIGFSFSSSGMLQIASGNYNDADSFKKNIIFSRQCGSGKTIAEVPFFGKEYTWRVVKGGPKNTVAAALHHFTTLPCANADTSKSQFRIISNSGRWDNCYVFVDNTGALYDMRGNLVWFIPAGVQQPFTKSGIRDLKATPSGTISFLSDDVATDIDYNGNIVFSGRGTGQVNGDTAEFFHHEFTRLANGHYMVLGSENVTWDMPLFHPDSVQSRDASYVKSSDGAVHQKLAFGTIIEYDENGKIVWSWKSSRYFKNSDLFTNFTPDGRFRFVDVHENAFSFDEKNSVVYLGFREISRILKIKYPWGDIVAEYGAKFESPDDALCNDLFCGQHRIMLNNDGDLCIYNNNATANGANPKIIVLKEIPGEKDGLRKVWEFDCTLVGMNESEQNDYVRRKGQVAMLNKLNPSSALATRLSSGGNVIALPDGCYFASMSGQFGKSFIVDKNKEILWSAVPEIRIYPGGPWTAVATYRASIITNKELESLIWNAK